MIERRGKRMSDNEKAIYILTELSKADKRIMFPKKDIAQALNVAIQALNQTSWIPVSEKPPQVGIDVLICDIEGDIFLTHRAAFGSYFAEDGCEIKNVKAWMPLPKPYKPERSEK
jgi:hypothetical protein